MRGAELKDQTEAQECIRQTAVADLLIELCRREIVVHHGGLEPCIRHGSQEAAALVGKCGYMLLDVGCLFRAVWTGLERGTPIHQGHVKSSQLATGTR